MALVPDFTRAEPGARLPSSKSRYAVTILFGAMAVLCAVGGGSAFPNILAVTAIRIAAVALLAALLLTSDEDELRRLAPFSRFSILAAAVVALQLIPLPPGIWAMLPGRGSYAAMASATVGPVWRPISMTPDLTLNTLLSLLIPVSAGLATAGLGPSIRARAVLFILSVGGLSAVLGLLQIAPGGGALRWYAISNDDAAVGVFTNRNHHAVFLATLIPFVTVAVRGHLAQTRRRDLETSWLIGSVAVGLGLAGVAVATGSRSGSIAALLGLLGAVTVWRADTDRARKTKMSPKMRLIAFAVTAGAVVTVVALAVLPGSGVRRLLAIGFGDDLRLAWLTPLFKMAVVFQPFGAGFGSFDSVYRNLEPFKLLQSTYLNAAHNDLLQIAIEGGVAAVALFAVFIWWWMRTTITIWSKRAAGQTDLLGRAATIATGLLMAASLFDYPLRTPLLACFFAVLSVWMQHARSQVVPLPVRAGSLGAGSSRVDRQSR